MRIKIYLLIIAVLVGYLIYENRGGYEIINVTQEEKTVNGVNYKALLGVEPSIIPQKIPTEVLQAAKENELYYYLFLPKARKQVVYSYKDASSDLKNSEAFHKIISEYIEKDMYDGMYKNQYFNEVLNDKYETGILNSKKNTATDPKEIQAQKDRLRKLLDFKNACAKTLCIINNNTNEYVLLDERDTNKAKELLTEYKLWE